MAHTTPPKEEKLDTSSAEAPTTQELVTQLLSKASDDNLTDDELVLLNFIMVESEIICQMSSRL
jgi:hypothetical protein